MLTPAWPVEIPSYDVFRTRFETAPRILSLRQVAPTKLTDDGTLVGWLDDARTDPLPEVRFRLDDADGQEGSMSWGFEVGRVYSRQADIHAKYGGQQQGGIITPSKHPVIFIITGEEGLEHGYADRHRPDGVFEYFGEGQVGDMTMQKGNRAIAEHSTKGKGLLLFRKTKVGLRFEGEVVYEANHIERAPDRNGADRNAIVFELRPLEAINESVELIAMPLGISLATLRERAMAAATHTVAKSTGTPRDLYKRSEDVRNYVLARAKGHCQGCTALAPFNRADGSPYLEPHHLRRVSDGGPDHPAFVIALCPNCHRRVHAGVDGKEYNSQLMALMKGIEPF